MDLNGMSIAAENGALIFTTKKEWELLPESRLPELAMCAVVRVFKGTTGVYFLLDRFPSPRKVREPLQRFWLVRVCIDEEGKAIFEKMAISQEESIQVKRNHFSVWG